LKIDSAHKYGSPVRFFKGGLQIGKIIIRAILNGLFGVTVGECNAAIESKSKHRPTGNVGFYHPCA
jgi:hypothetical protein